MKIESRALPSVLLSVAALSHFESHCFLASAQPPAFVQELLAQQEAAGGGPPASGGGPPPGVSASGGGPPPFVQAGGGPPPGVTGEGGGGPPPFVQELLAQQAAQKASASSSFASSETCDLTRTSPLAYPCNDDSSALTVRFQVGTIECGTPLTISQAGSAPYVAYRPADATKLYTLLLVDATQGNPVGPILHFGAVNIPGSDLIGGFFLPSDGPGPPPPENVQPFSNYRGPAPPPPAIVPGIDKQLFNYEFILAEQQGRVDPAPEPLESNRNFEYETFLEANTINSDFVTSSFASGYCVESATGPPCNEVTTQPNFDLAQYISARWYSHAQRPQPFQPAELLYCVSATYDTLPESDPKAELGYDISIFNYAQNAEGQVFTSDDVDSLGNTQGGPLCGSQFTFESEADDPAKLTVAQCFLPPDTFGVSNYWVVAYDEEEGMALIGSQPDVPTKDGLCTYSSPFGGLWIFSRSPERDEALVEKYRNIAREKGYDPSILVDVVQTNCGDRGEGGENTGAMVVIENTDNMVMENGSDGMGDMDNVDAGIDMGMETGGGQNLDSVQIEDSSGKYCWSVEGRVKVGANIIIDRCSSSNTAQRFDLVMDRKGMVIIEPVRNRSLRVIAKRAEKDDRASLRLAGINSQDSSKFEYLDDKKMIVDGLYVASQGLRVDIGETVTAINDMVLDDHMAAPKSQLIYKWKVE